MSHGHQLLTEIHRPFAKSNKIRSHCEKWILSLAYATHTPFCNVAVMSCVLFFGKLCARSLYGKIAPRSRRYKDIDSLYLKQATSLARIWLLVCWKLLTEGIFFSSGSRSFKLWITPSPASGQRQIWRRPDARAVRESSKSFQRQVPADIQDALGITVKAATLK